jgi:hypothetical protein
MEDFLEVDKELPNQKYVCLSFLSPEKILPKKELYFVQNFLKDRFDREIGVSELEEEYTTFLINHQQRLESEFFEKNQSQTTIRGLKVRGCYETYEEAQRRSQYLHQVDPSFHVYIGSVGYWLPWDPDPNHVTDQVYQENELNQLMKTYKENQIKRDIMYEQQKEDYKRKAMEENLMKEQDHQQRKESLG